MSVVPGEPEPVRGPVEVLDLLRQDGRVALLPAGDNVIKLLAFVTSAVVFYLASFLT